MTLDGNGFDGQVVDGSGAVLLELSGYRTVALPDFDPERGARLARAMTK